jgi:hypothetical protein
MLDQLVSRNTPAPQILPQKDAKVVPLGYPRTVCTKDKCIKTIIVDSIARVDYASHCHPHCYFTGVEQEAIGHEKLQNCEAMDKSLGKSKLVFRKTFSIK